MLKPETDPYLYYYHRELDYLRQAGQIFSKRYPKIARRLSLNQQGSEDPHVERLIESFAFLTSRLSKEMDDRLPLFSSSMLAILYPHLITPLPSASTVQFQVDPVQAKMTTGFEIAPKTPLFSYAQDGLTCHFRTVYPITLWPIEVTNAQFIPGETIDFSTFSQNHYSLNSAPYKGWYLKLSLSTSGTTFQELNIKTLRFHIASDRLNGFRLYESLFAQKNRSVFISEGKGSFRSLGSNSLNEVGFNLEDSLLPLPGHVHPAYSIVQDYFHFPEKFLYFDIDNLGFQSETQTVDLYIPLSSYEKVANFQIKSENFLLGCSPIINLFPKITDPFLLDYQKLDYRLVPDQRRERTTEIHSIDKIFLAEEGSPESHELSPYFSFSHNDIIKNNLGIYWLTKRVPSHYQDLEGTDILLSFVDENFNPTTPLNKTVYATTLCTNRHLPEYIPAGALMQIEDKTPAYQIICLTKPTSPAYTPRDGETMWQLISQLTVHHLSCMAPDQALKALKENLFLYARGQQTDRVFQEISSLEAIEIKSIVRRHGKEPWKGFVEGLGITLKMDENAIPGSSPFLLASVIKEFLALQSPLNSFTEVSLQSNQRKEMWMQWNPLSGQQALT